MATRHRLIMRAVLLALGSALLLTGGCTLFLAHQFQGNTGSGTTGDPGSGFAQYTIQAETVTLAWDPPASPVSAYKLFYRTHEAGAWTLFTEIPAQSDPSITLSQPDFGNGSFDFGVVAVGASGAESLMHTSLDNTAQPTSGWYLIWDL